MVKIKYQDNQICNIITAKVKDRNNKYLVIIASHIYQSLVGIIQRKPKNRDHVHKEQNDFLSVIIKFGTIISDGDTYFYHGICVYYLCQRDNVLKNSHKRYIVGPFEMTFHEGTI